MAKTNNVANVIFELHFSRQNKIEMITGFIKTNITIGLSCFKIIMATFSVCGWHGGWYDGIAD